MAGASYLQQATPELSIQDYKSREQDNLRSTSKLIETSFSQKVKIKLVALGYDDDELDEVTNEVLYEGVEIYENSDAQSQDILELNALEELHSKLCDRVFLIVYLHSNLPFAEVATDLSNESICELYPDMRRAPEMNPTHTVQVPTYAAMKHAVQEFITTTAKQSKKVVLVFHDECVPQPTTEPQQGGVDMLYKGSKEIMEQVGSTLEPGDVQLPQAMDIVLVGQNAIEIIAEDSRCTTKSTVKLSHPSAVNGFNLGQLNGDVQRVLQLESKYQGMGLSNVTTEGPSMVMEM